MTLKKAIFINKRPCGVLKRAATKKSRMWACGRQCIDINVKNLDWNVRTMWYKEEIIQINSRGWIRNEKRDLKKTRGNCCRWDGNIHRNAQTVQSLPFIDKVNPLAICFRSISLTNNGINRRLVLSLLPIFLNQFKWHRLLCLRFCLFYTTTLHNNLFQQFSFKIYKEHVEKSSKLIQKFFFLALAQQNRL